MEEEKNARSHRNPIPTVDIIIEIKDPAGKEGLVLIRRKNPPFGWALPGGFVDYGESLEQAAVREAEEETSLKIDLRYQLHTYSDPDRDSRRHTISTVFVARAEGRPKAGDDAEAVGIFGPGEIDFPLAFDHARVLEDYFAGRGRETKFEAGIRAEGEADMTDDPTKAEKPDQDMNLKELIRVWGPVEAEIIKNLLESEGIPCFFKGLMLQTIYPFSADGLGEVKILVREKDLETAKGLLENLEQKPPFDDNSSNSRT